jgi:hypothetical protein
VGAKASVSRCDSSDSASDNAYDAAHQSVLHGSIRRESGDDVGNYLDEIWRLLETLYEKTPPLTGAGRVSAAIGGRRRVECEDYSSRSRNLIRHNLVDYHPVND